MSNFDCLWTTGNQGKAQEDFTVVKGTCEDEEYPLIKEIKNEDEWQGVSFDLWIKDGTRSQALG